MQVWHIFLIQVHLSNNNDEVDRTVFQVYCPGEYNHLPHKLIMSDNESVSNNIRYQDLCTDKVVINIAYNEEPSVLEIVNNSMLELSKKYGDLHGDWVGKYSSILYDDEILSKFFLHYNIIVQWINCNYTWGWFDYDSGKWTGAVGKVNYSEYNFKTVFHFMLDTK